MKDRQQVRECKDVIGRIMERDLRKNTGDSRPERISTDLLADPYTSFQNLKYSYDGVGTLFVVQVPGN